MWGRTIRQKVSNANAVLLVCNMARACIRRSRRSFCTPGNFQCLFGIPYVRPSQSQGRSDEQTTGGRKEGRKEGRLQLCASKETDGYGAGWRAGDAGHKMADSLPPSLLSSDNNFDRRAG